MDKIGLGENLFIILQVGRALAISALDMYQLNPWSRLPTTEYGSVAGVRQRLLQRIHTSRTKKLDNITLHLRDGCGQ